MDENSNDRIEKFKSDDEIDLVDILAVIIKRKWTIIILLVLSIILSVAYVKLHKSKSISYSTSLSITLPEEYTINTDYLLGKNQGDPSLLIDELNQKINQYKTKNPGVVNITINSKNNKININISSISNDDASKAAIFIYKIYKDYIKTVLKKNEDIFNVAQASLDQQLTEKSAIVNMLMDNLKSGSPKNKNINGSLVYVIDFLSGDISKIKRIKTLNQNIMLNQGKIEISNGIDTLIISDDTVSQISSYVKAETPSKKKTVLPIAVSIFLALFVGIFLAFVIEFFSREDVKNRLKEASKR